MSARNIPNEQRDPYEDANAHFEGVGNLYFRRYRRLRPGKDEAAGTGRNSMDEDNLRQFQDWIKHEAFDDAIARINALETEVERLRDGLEDISLGARMMLDSPPMVAVHSYAAEVKRVADAAFFSNKTALKESSDGT